MKKFVDYQGIEWTEEEINEMIKTLRTLSKTMTKIHFY